MVADGVGGTFPASWHRFPHQKALSAFPSSSVFHNAKVFQARDKFPIGHNLGRFEEGFLQVNRVREGRSNLP